MRQSRKTPRRRCFAMFNPKLRLIAPALLLLSGLHASFAGPTYTRYDYCAPPYSLCYPCTCEVTESDDPAQATRLCDPIELIMGRYLPWNHPDYLMERHSAAHTIPWLNGLTTADFRYDLNVAAAISTEEPLLTAVVDDNVDQLTFVWNPGEEPPYSYMIPGTIAVACAHVEENDHHRAHDCDIMLNAQNYLWWNLCGSESSHSPWFE